MKAKRPIAKKFIAGIVVILLGITLFLLFFFPQNIKNTLLEKETTNAEVLIDVISVGAGFGLAEENFEILDLTIQIAKEFPNADYILFHDVSGNQIAAYNPNKLIIDSSYAALRDGTLMMKDKLIIKSPLFYQDKLFGSLILNYSLKDINQTIVYYQHMIMKMSLMILLIGALVAIAFSRAVTNPIRKLMDASNSVIKGDLDAVVKIDSNDEFGLLGNTFNFMLKSIKENSNIEAINAELREQQSLLETKNVELEEQSEQLKEQQNELESSNEALIKQKEQVAKKNELLQQTSATLFEKAKQLEISNNFKSEFLANMSHELRSPLNSMLILAGDLIENETKNLSEDQVQSAKIIYDGGKELLNLINDILDLSKVESGKMEVNVDQVTISDIVEEISNKFKRLANEKNLNIEVVIDQNMPSKITSDEQRIKQIMNNLLSNAIKFTEQGTVALKLTKQDDEYFNIIVSDTGIGIPKNKQQLIFNAFIQADGGTTRKYGGTGLGLAITSQLCNLLKGQISVSSEEGIGSEFSVSLPLTMQLSEAEVGTNKPQQIKPYIEEKEPRKPLNNKLILVIEDDQRFSAILSKEIAKMGFDVITTHLGNEGLALVREHLPGAIILDIGLPDISGLTVLEKLKSDEILRVIPVHIMSVSQEEDIRKGLDVVQYITKPVNKQSLKKAFEKIGQAKNRKIKTVLLVEDHKTTRQTLKKVLNIDEIEILDAATLAEAVEIISKTDYIDGVILDLKLPDGSGKELLPSLHKKYGAQIPHIIVYTGKEMEEAEVEEINQWAKRIIIKGDHSAKRLLDEITLFLDYTHKIVSEKENILNNNKYDVFTNKTALLVDDDMRNVFALSKMLVNKGINVIKASNGKMALEALEKENNIDIVLMDIMMPEMDGYEAMTRIRKMEQYKNIPIIALTAKAMKEDKEKCIKAGASDYMSKPIEIDKLFNLMRVWIN
jgi:signal transduction histidine kinase/DNA-binding response OmpR family regulator